MSGPLRLSGTPASGGYAEGPIFCLDGDAASYVPKGSAAAEAEALKPRSTAASEQLAVLAAASTGEAADMLEFQLAMLADDSLSGPAFDAIDAGAPADEAWADALAAEIAGYEAADDEYFRARAADLKDIRQQVLDALTSAGDRTAPPGAILFGEDIAPTRFLATDWSAGGGIALSKGSSASHVAMLARSRGVPMVVGLGSAAKDVAGLALLDAEHGGIVLRPTAGDIEGFRKSSTAYGERRRRAEDGVMRPAATENGVPVRVLVNVADPSDVDRIDIASCDGVGLMRTEFLFGKAPARRGDPIPRLPQGARMGRWQAGDDPHHRRRRRQAGAWLHRRGRQPVPGLEGHPPVAGAAGGFPRPDPRAAAGRGAWQSEGDVPDDLRAGGICARCGAVCGRGERPRSQAGVAAYDAAARHHGRGAVGGDRAGAVFRCRLLLDRLERFDAICDGGGARQHGGRGAQFGDEPGGAAADRGGRRHSAGCTTSRSACAATPAAIRPPSLICSRPACATFPSRRRNWRSPRRRSQA